MNDTNICKTCNWFDGLACRNNQEICIDNCEGENMVIERRLSKNEV